MANILLSDKIPEDHQFVIIETLNDERLLVECSHCKKSKRNRLGIIFWNDAWSTAYHPSVVKWWSE